MPVNTIAISASSAAAITSLSRIEPPGWITAVMPALAALSMPSRNGKKASEAITAPFTSRPACSALIAAIRAELTRLIEGLAEAAALDGKVFHAGTALKDGQVVTSGGRVLCATAIGESVSAAQQQAYRLAEKIRWNGCFYRKDIGYRAIARERGESCPGPKPRAPHGASAAYAVATATWL